MNEEALEEFKKIYKDEYGVELDDKSARAKAEKLMTIIEAIYKPIMKDEYRNFVNSTKQHRQ